MLGLQERVMANQPTTRAAQSNTAYMKSIAVAAYPGHLSSRSSISSGTVCRLHAISVVGSALLMFPTDTPAIVAL
uniref:Uncharacterized protein n=1 Tax=Arundo donax TaxID=35708 RepID=A0A0A8ZC64_ARUDO